MSRLKKVSAREEKAVIQKTLRIPVELYDEFVKVMKDADVDKFNFAVEKLIEMEVEDWKREKKRLEKKQDTKKKDKKNDSKKES